VTSERTRSGRAIAVARVALGCAVAVLGIPACSGGGGSTTTSTTIDHGTPREEIVGMLAAALGARTRGDIACAADAYVTAYGLDVIETAVEESDDFDVDDLPSDLPLERAQRLMNELPFCVDFRGLVVSLVSEPAGMSEGDRACFDAALTEPRAKVFYAAAYSEEAAEIPEFTVVLDELYTACPGAMDAFFTLVDAQAEGQFEEVDEAISD
jgi:hypothetical protein